MLLPYLGIFYLVVVRMCYNIFSYLIIILVPLSLTSCYICGTYKFCPALYPRTLGLWIIVRMLCKVYYMCCHFCGGMSN